MDIAYKQLQSLKGKNNQNIWCVLRCEDLEELFILEPLTTSHGLHLRIGLAQVMSHDLRIWYYISYHVTNTPH